MKLKGLFILATCCLLAACAADDDFSTSTNNRLTFSIDSVKIDTVFSTVPSSTRTFWVYNNSGSGIRCKTVKLAKGNQTGFRVNVDGIYLGTSEGFQTTETEVRNKDSIRVFVEVTTPRTQKALPQLIEDDLVFVLESGVEQRVNLSAWAWDAELMRDVHIRRDTTICTETPIVIYDGLTVDSGATLRVTGTTLYFHDGAGIEVFGKLITDAHEGRETMMRGDRLDHMFDYLPYDRVSGQWKGVHFHESSTGNVMSHTDIHAASDAISVDSAAIDSVRPRLEMSYCTVHNAKGNGIRAEHAHVVLNTCEISNTLGPCLWVDGGRTDVRNTTLAQFYPYDAARGAALRFSNQKGDLHLFAVNNLMTGYENDVIAGAMDTTHVFDMRFENCLLRTPKPDDKDSLLFHSCLFEEAKDTAQAGKRHFVTIDEKQLRYDFRLKAGSPAVDAANPVYSLPTDRVGVRREEKPAIGAYEATK